MNDDEVEHVIDYLRDFEGAESEAKVVEAMRDEIESLRITLYEVATGLTDNPADYGVILDHGTGMARVDEDSHFNVRGGS